MVLLTNDDDGSEPDEPAAGLTPSPEEIDELADRTLTESIEKEEAGLKVSYPEGWKRSERSGIVTLESPDQCTAISFATPVAAAQAKRLREDSIAALRRTFKKIELRRGTAQEVGGAPTTGAAIAVRNKQGNPILIRLAVSRAKEFAHLTQVVLRAPPCENSDTQTALILGSVEFTR